MSTNAPDHSTTSLGTIVVEKDKLLATLRDNRDTHKQVFEAACAGYWVQTETTLEAKKAEFSAAVTAANEAFGKQYSDFGGGIKLKAQDTLKPFAGERSYGGSQWTLGFNLDWVPAYPVNHLEDYDRAITMLEFSVADKVSLAANDFDAYVRNNWKWKDEFANGNLNFVRCVTGSLFASGGLTSKVHNYAISGGCSLVSR